MRIAEHLIFDGNEGWQYNGQTYRLVCAVNLAQAHDGTLIAAWLAGADREPANDNCVVAARSKDGGRTWSEPSMVLPSGEMMGALSAFYTQPDGRLSALVAYLPTEKHYTEWHYMRMDSLDAGETWGEPVPLTTLPENNVAFEKPRRIQTGEYLWAAQHFAGRDSVPAGSPFDLAHAESEEAALAVPASSDGSHAGKFGTHRHGVGVMITDTMEGDNLRFYGPVDNRPLGLLEPAVAELDDGTLVMLARAEWGGFLWRTESRDHGRTWSRAWQTDIPNPTSKVSLQKLPDGRTALIHNAVGGVVGRNAPRDPMSVWISDDGMRTWSLKEDVVTGGQLAYPDAMLVDGGLVFGYDRDRRQAWYVEVEV